MNGADGAPKPASVPLRIFLGAFGQPGHAFPMLALGERLARRGHLVTCETWERWRPQVLACGMEFSAAPSSTPGASGRWGITPYEAAERAVAQTRAAIRATRAEVVVHDILTLAPALAAELEGIPAATLIPHLYPVSEPGMPAFASGVRPPRTRAGRRVWRALELPMEAGLRIGRRQLNATRARVGLPPTDRLHGGLSDELCLVATLPALEYPRSWREHVHVVGPLLWEPPAPAAAPPPGAAPLVVIAPSTSKDPSHRLLRSSLAGLRDLDVRVLASLDRRPLPQPVNAGRAVRLVNWMSYEQAMSDASLVICHGGHGTVVRALAAGVPVLALPHGGDMAENAVRLVWSGAGMRLPWAALHPLTLRACARRALALMPELTARTAEMAAWAAAHDGPTRAATLIERLAG